MNEKVSVILPIYNVEPYLERCIRSVVNQTYNNLEIILVDDGSPDKCPQICEKWKNKDSRIVVIHKKNEGLGMARNSGLDVATGEYVCFFDSDDYIKEDAIEKCISTAQENRADIVIYGFSDVDAQGNVIKTMIPHTKKDLYVGAEVQADFLPDLIAPDIVRGIKSDLWMSAWCSFYSMDLIKRSQWKFVSERKVISEDIYSLLDLYSNVNRVCVLKQSLYFYCANESSLTHVFKEDRFEKIKIFYDECVKIANKHGYNSKTINRLTYPYISNTLAALKLIITSSNLKEEKKVAVYSILKDKHLRNVILNTDYHKDIIQRRIFMNMIVFKMYSLCYYLLCWRNKNEN